MSFGGGRIKLNTNGSSKHDGREGCGGLVRVLDGDWFCGFSFFLGELLCVYDGIRVGL